MIIETELDYTFTTGMQVSKFNKLHKTNYKIGDTIKVKIEELATKRDYRRKQIKCKCDDCNKIFYKRLDIAVKTNAKYCKYCICKGNRSYLWNKHLSEETKKKISNASKGEKNGFYGKTHSKEHCEKRRQLMLGNKCHYGCRNTPKQLKHISDGVIRGYKNGTRAKTHGNSLKGEYKNIIYQSSYELELLKHLDKYHVLNDIKRGPTIQYIGLDRKQHSYLSDYYIERLDFVIEVKSTHFWNLDLDTHKLKIEATKKLHNVLIVLDNNFLELDKLLDI